MHYVTDLHLHSKYSRAVSQNMTLPVMAFFARQKGIDILSATDFTHPLWFKEIQGLLKPGPEGLYTLKDDKDRKPVYFLLSVEISSIYKQGDKVRRIHNLVFVPDFETVEKVNKELLRRGCNLSADGRPIVGLSSKNLLELILSINEQSLLIPCHIWTPHFGIYGSASGFDSLEEAFSDLAPYVYAIETGLSSDPDMNWQVEELMNRAILSFSDAHSPAKMAREATVFDLIDPSYSSLREAITRLTTKNGTKNKIAYTIEFYPEEGKYHFSGHRNCKISLDPDEILQKGTSCPVCKKRVTEGVLLRVRQLSDESLLHRSQEKKNDNNLKWYIDSMKIQPPYVKLVPLLEIVAKSMNSTVASQKVKDVFARLCEKLGSEITVLLKSDPADIIRIAGERVSEGVMKTRAGDIFIEPGYDGEYGRVEIWKKEEANSTLEHAQSPQLRLDL